MTAPYLIHTEIPNASGVAYNLSAALMAGTTPLIATALVATPLGTVHATMHATMHAITCLHRLDIDRHIPPQTLKTLILHEVGGQEQRNDLKLP